MRYLLPLCLIAVLGLAACDTADVIEDPVPQTLVADTLANVVADPTTGRDPDTGAPLSDNRFTFVSLRTGEVILASTETARADSNSTMWDLAFRGTEIIANGGESGPGQGGVQILTGTFDDIASAPQDGYVTSFPAGSGNSWYNYDPATFTVTPTPGRVLVVKTADGRYAKVRILSYYQDSPDPIDPFSDPDRYYTFEYVFQPDGTAAFTTTTP